MPAVRFLAVSVLLSCAAGTLPACAETVQIIIDKMKFVPAEAEAKVGDTVVWVNKDFVDHSATTPSDWDVIVPANRSGSLVLKQPGAFSYYCRYHPDMEGRLLVAK